MQLYSNEKGKKKKKNVPVMVQVTLKIAPLDPGNLHITTIY